MYYHTEKFRIVPVTLMHQVQDALAGERDNPNREDVLEELLNQCFDLLLTAEGELNTVLEHNARLRQYVRLHNQILTTLKVRGTGECDAESHTAVPF